MKINLPLLQNLTVEDTRSLVYFSGLKSLRILCIREKFAKIENIQEAFDPKNIH
jgi:hypothetical protein